MGKIYCCAQGCSNFSGKIVNGRKMSMHRFPAVSKIRKIWVQRIKNHRKNFVLTDNKLKTARLCGAHFVESQGPTPNVPIPSIFPQKIYKSFTLDDYSICTPVTKSEDLDTDRLEEAGPDDIEDKISDGAGNLVLEENHCLNTSIHMHDYAGEVESPTINLTDKYIQTDKEPKPEHNIVHCKCEEIAALPPRPVMIDKGVQTSLPDLVIEDIQSDDSVMFYTGFPSLAAFMMIFNAIKPLACCMSYWKGEGSTLEKKYQKDGTKKPGPTRKLRLIDEFFMVYMRLRLGILLEDLSQRFKISVSTCSSICRTWTRLLVQELVPLLMPWPSKEAIVSNMPECFHIRYPDTRIILDCTELRSETPESHKAKTLLYSNYKSHMTWKVLVGITPSGVPSFVSRCYNGSVSDKKITELTGVLDLCEAGDAIMVDKGFLISGTCTEKQLKLIIPPFKTKHKFSRREVEETRRIANLRIHVERQMERTKNFRILQGIIPITSHNMISDLFQLCSAMTVLQGPLVKN